MHKTKVCVITMDDTKYNYGNKLQNYALIKVLDQLGYEPCSLYFKKSETVIIYRIKLLCTSLNKKNYLKNRSYWRKKIRFIKFRKYFLKGKYFKNINVAKKFTYYIVGSDQIWNPLFWDSKGMGEFALLSFAGGGRRIAYAPSFGVDAIPQEYKSLFYDNLKKLDYLSVREESGKRIVYDLIGTEPNVLPDPTLLLDRDEWNDIAICPIGVGANDRYILLYFLGGINQQTSDLIDKIARENNLKIFNLLDYTSFDVFESGPQEFIYLISNAALILTDSFHACVFSFLYQKPFLVFQREGDMDYMFSRIETFLVKYGLERKYYSSDFTNELFESNYSVGYQILNKEREIAIEYLKKALT